MSNFEEDTKKEFDDWFEINRELIEAILLRAFLAGVGVGITKTQEINENKPWGALSVPFAEKQ